MSKPNYSRYHARFSADDVMEIACERYCKYYADCEAEGDEERLQSHCNECRLKLMVGLSIRN